MRQVSWFSPRVVHNGHTVTQQEHHPSPGDTAAAPDEAAAGAVWGAQIRRAMEALSSAQRAVLASAYFERLTQSQIATKLGLPLATVQATTAAGLQRLAALIEASRSER